MLVRGIVGLKWMDTQCGAKVISGRSYRAVSERLVEDGFVFDVEYWQLWSEVLGRLPSYRSCGKRYLVVS